MKYLQKALDILSVLITIILIIIIIVLINNKINNKNKATEVFGHYIFKVASGSMEPAIKTGDYILIKKTKSFKKDDVVTYKEKGGNYITHRIIDIKDDKYYLKGDANSGVDAPVTKDKIIGKYVKNLKILRNILNFILNNYIFIIGFIIIVYLISALIKYIKKI